MISNAKKNNETSARSPEIVREFLEISPATEGDFSTKQHQIHQPKYEDDRKSSKRSKPRECRFLSTYPREFIIGEPSKGIVTRSSLKNKTQMNNFSFISNIEPKSTSEALNDKAWVKTMKEELQQFDKNQVWQLVPKHENCSIIGSRWVCRNKLDENGKIVRNKARSVA